MWDQSFYLYVKDPESAALTFRAMDKDLFKDDDLLGLGAISVKELIVSGIFLRIFILAFYEFIYLQIYYVIEVVVNHYRLFITPFCRQIIATDCFQFFLTIFIS